MSQPLFTLLNSRNEAIITLRGSTDPEIPAEYNIFREDEQDESHLIVELHREHATELERSTGPVLARVHVQPPLVKIRAQRSNERVFVMPGHFDKVGSSDSAETWQIMELEKSGNGQCTWILLRPGDIIRIGQDELTVRTTDKRHGSADIQVGSSIPNSAEERAPPDDFDKMAKVKNSFLRAADSFTGEPLSKPTVAETPTSRETNEQYRLVDDSKMHPAGTDEASQMPEALRERMQFSTGSPSRGESDFSTLALKSQERYYECVDSESEEPAFATARSETLHCPTVTETYVQMASNDDSGIAIPSEDTSSDFENGDIKPVKTNLRVRSASPSLSGRKRKRDVDGTDQKPTKKSATTPEGSHIGKVSDDSDDDSRCSISVIIPDKSAGWPQKGSTPSFASGRSLSQSQPGATPASSAKSGKSAPRPDPVFKSPRMIFSNSSVLDRSHVMKVLTREGAKEVDKTTARGFDVLIVGSGELKTTYKLLTAVVLGKPILRETWAFESAKAGELIDMSAYIIEDDELGGEDRRSLFKSMTIFITPAMKREYGVAFNDIESLLKLAGAKVVQSKPARDMPQASESNKDIIIISREKNDIDAQSLTEHGWICYTKEFISSSILRGSLQFDDDKLKAKMHLLKQSTTKGKSGKKGR